MFAAVLVLAAGLVDAPSIAEYFPLVPGTTWNYEDTEGKRVSRFEDRVAEPVSVDGTQAWPLTSKTEGQATDTAYYRYEGGSAMLVGYDPKKPLERAYAVLKLGEGKTTWVFDGTTAFMGEPAPLHMKGESRQGRVIDVLGTKRPTVTAILEATIEGGPTILVKSKQTCIYAKGVGLVDMRETVTIGKTRTERHRRLIAFEAGAQPR